MYFYCQGFISENQNYFNSYILFFLSNFVSFEKIGALNFWAN